MKQANLTIGHKAAILWLTGFSGAGKTTIALNAAERLQQLGYPVYSIDGDLLRRGLCKDLGFSDQDRKENSRRAAHVALLFFNLGYIVICSMISPFESDRHLARHLFPKSVFFEVYVRCSLEVCILRDPKNLYRLYREGKITNLTGIDSTYETPTNPEIIIDTEERSVGESVLYLMEILATKKVINHI